MSKKPIVGIVMGSNSDWDTMQHAAQMLEQFGIAHEAQVLSAHRMPDDMFQYAEKAQANGLQAIIAGAGGAVAGVSAGCQVCVGADGAAKG